MQDPVRTHPRSPAGALSHVIRGVGFPDLVPLQAWSRAHVIFRTHDAYRDFATGFRVACTMARPVQ